VHTLNDAMSLDGAEPRATFVKFRHDVEHDYDVVPRSRCDIGIELWPGRVFECNPRTGRLSIAVGIDEDVRVSAFHLRDDWDVIRVYWDVLTSSLFRGVIEFRASNVALTRFVDVEDPLYKTMRNFVSFRVRVVRQRICLVRCQWMPAVDGIASSFVSFDLPAPPPTIGLAQWIGTRLAAAKAPQATLHVVGRLRGTTFQFLDCFSGLLNCSREQDDCVGWKLGTVMHVGECVPTGAQFHLDPMFRTGLYVATYRGPLKSREVAARVLGRCTDPLQRFFGVGLVNLLLDAEYDIDYGWLAAGDKLRLASFVRLAGIARSETIWPVRPRPLSLYLAGQLRSPIYWPPARVRPISTGLRQEPVLLKLLPLTDAELRWSCQWRHCFELVLPLSGLDVAYVLLWIFNFLAPPFVRCVSEERCVMFIQKVLESVRRVRKARVTQTPPLTPTNKRCVDELSNDDEDSEEIAFVSTLKRQRTATDVPNDDEDSEEIAFVSKLNQQPTWDDIDL